MAAPPFTSKDSTPLLIVVACTLEASYYSHFTIRVKGRNIGSARGIGTHIPCLLLGQVKKTFFFSYNKNHKPIPKISMMTNVSPNVY
jgi:hypothetical protein